LSFAAHKNLFGVLEASSDEADAFRRRNSESVSLHHEAAALADAGNKVLQDCQIFLDPKYQNGEKYTKLPQNIPNGNKIFPMAIK
jgi:hypothetical protein